MVDRNRDQDVDRNVVADVEYAELGPTVQRKVGEPVEHRRTAPPEVADQDLLIARDDLGSDSSTFIAKGAPIPPTWPDFPAGQLGRPASRSRAACRGGTGGYGPGLPTVRP
jgi:hypothetical protein